MVIDDRIRKWKYSARADHVFSKNIRIRECPLKVENAQDHRDPGIRVGGSTVMLSTFAALSVNVNSAKYLSATSVRPFAIAQGDRAAAQGDRAVADDETSQDAALASLIIPM